MEESEEILLNSLASSGVPIPPGVSSIQDLTQATLVSITAQSLRLIDETLSFRSTLPEFSMADRYKICMDLASAVKNLGYIGDISCHKFLYPSEEDTYKLVRFFVGRLSESFEAGKSSGKKGINPSGIVEEENFKSTTKEWTEKIDNEGVYSHSEDIITRLKDMGSKAEVQESLVTMPEDALVTVPNERDSVPEKMERVATVDIYSSGTQDANKDKLTGNGLTEDFEDSINTASGKGEPVAMGDNYHVLELERKLTSHEDHSSKMKYDIEKLQNQEKTPVEEMSRKLSKVQNLEEEQELLKTAAEMACDEQHPVDFNIMQLRKHVDARKHNLVELDSQGDSVREPLEGKNRILEEALYAAKPECQEKLQKIQEIESEMQSIFSETKKREEELLKLSTDLEKQPKLASRRSYIQRIKEITKNSRKQDTDIERILKETRELQLESNSIQERLHRTYAVVDETVFREAKKDSVGRQAYRLLTSIHESFEQISEKILFTDRTRREATDHEGKLAAMGSRSLNIDKLQADLDAIRKENEFLQQRVHNS